MTDKNRQDQQDQPASYRREDAVVFDPEAPSPRSSPGGKRAVGIGLPRPGDPYPFYHQDQGGGTDTDARQVLHERAQPDIVIDPEAPGYDPTHFLPEELRGLGGASTSDGATDEEETVAEAELRAAIRAEEVWKARLGVTGPQAEERERLKALRLVVGTGRAKPPQADPTSYEEHEQRRREIEEKLERERARRKRNRGR